MANFHVRSKSLPSESHPTVHDVEDQLCRLKSSEAASNSASTIFTNLDRLRNLHEDIHDLIQLPSIQQVLSSNKLTSELLDGSLVLVDLCGFARDVCLTKESIQELQSSVRRNRGGTATTDEVNAYEASRKKIKKMVKSYIKKSKSFIQNLELINDLKLAVMLREMDSFAYAVLKSVLALVSPAKGSWTLLSMFTRSSQVQECDSDQDLLSFNASSKSLKQLKALEMMTLELEEGLQSLSRSLVKTRVSLLNALNH